MVACAAKATIHECKRNRPQRASPAQFGPAVRERAAQRRIAWTGPVLLLLARSVLWLSAQSLVALLFMAQRRANPWRQACYWWSVCFTLADVGCILGMRFLLKREGLRLRDLFGPIRLRYAHDFFLGIRYFLLFSPGSSSADMSGRSSSTEPV